MLILEIRMAEGGGIAPRRLQPSHGVQNRFVTLTAPSKLVDAIGLEPMMFAGGTRFTAGGSRRYPLYVHKIWR